MGFVLDLQGQVGINDNAQAGADSTIISTASLSVCVASTVSAAGCATGSTISAVICA
ncbi:hypothetical protein [Nocardiopsis aegyptia]|uniref:Uncharacterized protein n=1 Tax=Nocardiopsis aegyptia TaxID=220378 RepID=A0A7Z0JBW2_9ACTN|nr:hypothetical protein [Nocardiopsis aegyptia]NYJ35839.1 hypothetical protein [Nocardiopsis aegyptia]